MNYKIKNLNYVISSAYDLCGSLNLVVEERKAYLFCTFKHTKNGLVIKIENNSKIFGDDANANKKLALDIKDNINDIIKKEVSGLLTELKEYYE